MSGIDSEQVGILESTFVAELQCQIFLTADKASISQRIALCLELLICTYLLIVWGILNRVIIVWVVGTYGAMSY